MPFVELSTLTNFTFLTGAAHPEEMMLRAVELGMPALAVADVNSVAGIVRAHTKARELARDGGPGVRLIPDLCWCSVTEPVFPPHAQGLLTNSGKYAHYAHGLSGRHARLASLADCVAAAVSGQAPTKPPDWLA